MPRILFDGAKVFRSPQETPDVTVDIRLFADATMVEAVLDRLVHQAYRTELRSESLRKTLPPQAASGTTES